MATFENHVWYKLDGGTGLATISYEEPPGGDWKSLRGTTKSKFVFYEGEKDDEGVQRIFSCTFRVSSDYILKPLMFTWDENQECWIIFYPRFTEFDRWWKPKLANVKRSLSGKVELQFWLVKNARKIVKDLIQAHTEGVAHGHLEDMSEYAIVEENPVVTTTKPAGKLMLINFSIRRTEEETDEDWKDTCVADLEDFLKVVQSLNEGYRDKDLEIIINYLDKLKGMTSYTSEHIISFPYWKKPSKRLKVFFDADKSLKSNAGPVTEIGTMVEEGKAFKLPWDTNFEDAPTLQDSEVQKGLKKVYKYRSREGESYADLVEFLRDVYVHATNQGIYNEYDSYVNRKYPGFACIVHMFCCIE